jgi:hypothetical protein
MISGGHTAVCSRVSMSITMIATTPTATAKGVGRRR